MILDDYIQSLLSYKGLAPDIVCHRVIPPRQAQFASDDATGDPVAHSLLASMGIQRLYAHQADAMAMIRKGRHTVIATPTASGKSLIYNLPVIQALLSNTQTRALYLFPLKALARDQLDTITRLLSVAEEAAALTTSIDAAVYDGDVSAYKKGKIRKNPPNILLSNPEMLHLSLLAHHHLWKAFFESLRYVVVDEVHTYRGVMGSNMAWVFRRLIRICRYYGSEPIFIFCSATIANPAGLTRMLTGLDVEVIEGNTAPRGKKDVILMQGADGAARTAIDLIHAAVHRKLRTIVYTQSRKITELIAVWSAQKAGPVSDRISAYRAGFLPEERREIERRLVSGDLLAVVSTSALELGIDIGTLDLCILVGYPGTIMSTWQRAGRVGRKGTDSALILIAHEDALDQYFINHPDIFFDLPPEHAIINPENDVISQNHLECAAAENALSVQDPLATSPAAAAALKVLEQNGRVLKSENARFWYAARQSPHRHVNLRGTSRSMPIFLQDTQQMLGDMDRHRAFFEAHEGAVYLHRGETYVITELDHEDGVIQALPRHVNYFTRARSTKNTDILEVQKNQTARGASLGFGRLKITEQVTGYQKRQVATQKSLGVVPLDLPVIEFETQGLWVRIPDAVREEIESRQLHFMGGIHAMEHAMIGILPLLVMTDRNDLGGISIPHHPQVGGAAVFIYDGVPGGLGLTRTAFDRGTEMIEHTLKAVSGCPCDNGCPACVHSPKCGSGNRPIDKAACQAILEMLLSDAVGFPPSADTVFSKPPVIEEQVDVMDVVTPDRSGQTYTYAVLDLETRRSAQEVGGWQNAHRMEISCAVIFDSRTNDFTTYLQDQMQALISHLKAVDLIIGFNIIRFDYKVLSGLSDFDFQSLPTLDLLTKVHERLGFRLSLNHLAGQTLGEKKSADGLQALEWWKQGRMNDIIEYCTQDVRVTRDLFEFGRTRRYLLFKNKAGHKVRIPVQW